MSSCASSTSNCSGAEWVTLPENEEGCWVCGSLDVAYTDVLKMNWCDDCFEDIYLGKLDE